jgi:hypothetical protein
MRRRRRRRRRKGLVSVSESTVKSYDVSRVSRVSRISRILRVPTVSIVYLLHDGPLCRDLNDTSCPSSPWLE